MGKWTSQHYDEVLGSKIKSLVSGSVKRAKFERTENTISYETFVEELDSGDSFTTALVDLLVKELSERRQRKTSEDRRLISDSTSRSLRLLAAPARVYRARDRDLAGRAPRRQLATRYELRSEYLDIDEDGDSTDSVLDAAAPPDDLWMAVRPTTSVTIAPGGSTPAEQLAAAHRRHPVDRPLPGIPATSAISSSSPAVAQHLRTLFDGPSSRHTGRATEFIEHARRRRSDAREEMNRAAAYEAASASENSHATASAEIVGGPDDPPRRFFPPFPAGWDAPTPPPPAESAWGWPGETIGLGAERWRARRVDAPWSSLRALSPAGEE